MRFRSFVTALVIGFLTLPVLQGQESAPGKAAFEKVCVSCHEAEAVLGARRTRIGWEQTVEDMAARGAEGSEEQMAAIVDYLTRNFGKLNVNTAAAAEMEKTLGLASKEAQAIVEYREKNGKIKDFEELKKVPGVNAEKLQAKRGLIAFVQ